MQPLRQLLQTDRHLHPFSDDFKADKLQHALQAAARAGQRSDDLSVGMAGFYFRQCYEELRQQTRTLLTRQDLTVAEWEAALLAHCNLTYQRGRQQGLAQLRQQDQASGVFSSNSLQTLELATAAGRYRLADTLATHVDALQQLLGYLPYLAAAPPWPGPGSDSLCAGHPGCYL